MQSKPDYRDHLLGKRWATVLPSGDSPQATFETGIHRFSLSTLPHVEIKTTWLPSTHRGCKGEGREGALMTKFCMLFQPIPMLPKVSSQDATYHGVDLTMSSPSCCVSQRRSTHLCRWQWALRADFISKHHHTDSFGDRFLVKLFWDMSGSWKPNKRLKTSVSFLKRLQQTPGRW